jgi:hypothetical protein
MRPLLSVLLALSLALPQLPAAPFGIHVVDSATGRGVPLVTLTTVNDITLVTDSAGWAAFDEPGLMNQPVFFHVASPGYQKPKDGFGYSGQTLTTTPGKSAQIAVDRLFPAERLCRLSGQGLYRDSLLLGLATPHPRPAIDGAILGLDSVQVTPFQNRHLWIWGDTNLPAYPLGNFHATGALSDTPSRGGLHPDHGIAFDYFTSPNHQAKPMAPLPEPGPVWLFGLLTITDDARQERVITHFTRQKSLTEVLEHGLMEFNPASQTFTKIRDLPLSNTWQFPRSHALRVTRDGQDHFYFCDPFPTTRVPATLNAILDPSAYEALTIDPSTHSWIWQKTAPPITQKSETELLKSGKLPPNTARLQLRDPQGNPVQAHGGTLQWNPHRRRWITLFVQHHGKKSFLGEVWYAESRNLTGPWGPAVQIASHPDYSFYNPAHHPFLDQQNGRLIYFEGTFTRTFSGNPLPVPRYEYNQLLYRLDLDDPRLKAARIP